MLDTEQEYKPIEIRWCWEPDDLLNSLDLLLVYLGFNDRIQRREITAPINRKRPQEDIIPFRRAIVRKAWKASVCLLCPAKRKPIPFGGFYWGRHPRTDYRERLALAGIDIDTVKVFDRRRFAFAWSQLTEHYMPHYSIVTQKKLLENEDAPIPELKPKVTTYNITEREKLAIHQRKLREMAKAPPPESNGEIGVEAYESLGQRLINRKHDAEL